MALTAKACCVALSSSRESFFVWKLQIKGFVCQKYFSLVAVEACNVRRSNRTYIGTQTRKCYWNVRQMASLTFWNVEMSTSNKEISKRLQNKSPFLFPSKLLFYFAQQKSHWHVKKDGLTNPLGLSNDFSRALKLNSL